MTIIYDKFLNNVKKVRAALRFHQFTRKLLQIRVAEQWAKFTSTKRKRYKQPGLPVDIVIRCTEKCFLKCKFCGQGGENGRVDRSTLDCGPVAMETFHKIIAEVNDWPVKPFIKITGGEPLTLGMPFLDVLQKMRECGIIVKLNTNGMMLKNRKIARRIAETDLNYLSISLDGEKDVHNELRGSKYLFTAMMEGIDNVQYYRKKLGKRNLMILISMVISSDTQDQIENVYRIAVEKKVDWFNIQFLNYTTKETCDQAHIYFKNKLGIDDRPWDGFCNPRFNKIDPNFIEKQINKILSLRKSVPISVMGGLSTASQISKYYFSKDNIRNNICIIPFTGMHIVPPGRAAYCIDYPFYEYGDIRKESLESIWFGKNATEFRKDMICYFKENDSNFPQCRRCNWRFN